MTLMEKIKQMQVEARKESAEIAPLLTTLLGEAGMIGKNDGNRETTDSEVVAVVKKFIKNIDETIAALTSRNQSVTAFELERNVLESFLPKQLTEDELLSLIKDNTFTNMALFMKFLKENHTGKYDGKMASTVAKQFFG